MPKLLPFGAVGSLLFLLLMTEAAFAEEGTRRYMETHGDRSSAVQYTVTRGAGFVTVASSGGVVTDETRWTADAGTVSWHEVRSSAGTDLRAERQGNTVLVSGTLKGAPVKKEVALDAAPWYQLFGPGIQDLLPAGASKREFWVIDPSDLAPHRMLARRVGTERIDLGGMKVDAFKIHFSPAGALAPFWGADFWYRPADSVWLYSRLPEDGGLTVTTIAEPGK
jgi:hypothetical protein